MLVEPVALDLASEEEREIVRTMVSRFHLAILILEE